MRYSFAAVALMAGSAVATYEYEAPAQSYGLSSAVEEHTTSEAAAPTSVVYETAYHTITSCAETVTDCPAKSTAVYTSVYPVTSDVEVPTSAPYEAPSWSAPAPSYSAPEHPVPVPSNGTWYPTETVSHEVPMPTGPAECVPSHSTEYKTKTITTVIEEVETMVHEVPCEGSETTPSVPEVPGETYVPPPPPAATSEVPYPPPGNGTQPPVPTSPTTAGAAGLVGSAAFAAVAGVVAVFLA